MRHQSHRRFTPRSCVVGLLCEYKFMMQSLDTLQNIFSRGRYLTIALCTALLAFVLSVWIQNYGLIFEIFTLPTTSLLPKVAILLSLLSTFGSGVPLFSVVLIVISALLFGVAVALFVYYIREHNGTFYNHGATLGISGVVASIFGVGCAACGTIVLTSLLGIFGAAGLLSLLPFGGSEFGVAGVLVLIWSVLWILKSIAETPRCLIE